MIDNKNTIQGKIIDVVNERIYNGVLTIENQKIRSIKEVDKEFANYILPGLIDAHVHIESSMLVPSEFAKLAVRNGTVATVSDPHEIANVMGIEGVKFMIENASSVPFKFYFGAPSCVPATNFETSGCKLLSKDVFELLKNDNIYYLSEMMNFPGVISEDEEVLRKIKYALQLNKPIDGHAPGLTGEQLIKYAKAGITTDHESSCLDEAIEKIKLGIKLLIREGSAAKNFTALYKAIDMYPEQTMLCTDDAHPHDLLKGHINTLIKKGINYDVNFFNLIKAATLNPIKHYNLDVGLLQKGDKADFIVVEDLKNLNILKTYINGQLVFDKGKVLFNSGQTKNINNFKCKDINEDDIKVPVLSEAVNVIEAIDGELYTNKIVYTHKSKNKFLESNTKDDILKIVVLNRYNTSSKPIVGFIKNFNLKNGAIATSIAHDSHNIIAVGVSDTDIIKAINIIISNKGGIAVINENNSLNIQLEIAGIMTSKNGEQIATKYTKLEKEVFKMGTKLKAPFMTLSFMALLVIPEIKIGDKCLFDVQKFVPISLFV